MNSSRWLIVLFALIAFGGLLYGERLPDEYERVLIPVLPVGSWPAQLWIRNDGTEPVDLFPLVRDADSPSRGTFFPLNEPGVQPGQTLEYPVVFSPSPMPYYVPLTPTYSGAILYVERGKGQNVRFQLRVAGDTQIPVVPEQDFVATPLSLLRINIIPGKRYTLRVYSLDQEPSVAVEFAPEVGGLPVDSQFFRLNRVDAIARCAFPPCPWPDVPFAPAYAALFFDTTTVPPWNYRITVTADPGTKIWAFLSETDVVTRDVRVFTPN